MAVSLHTQKWAAEVHKQLFENVDYTSLSQNFSSMEDSSKFTIPSQGSITISEDDYTRPLTAATRTDTGVEISLAALRSDPMYVKLDEQWELNFDKRADITSHMATALSDASRQRIYWGWMNTAQMSWSVKTSGTASASKPTGATGTRKKITYNDIIDASLVLDEHNIQADGRIMVIPPAMYKDVKALSQFTASESISTELLSQGVIGYIDGIKVIKANVNNVLVDSVASGSTASGVTFGATGTTYSYFAAIYHPSSVARVIGKTEMFVNTGDALYTSDVVTSTQRYAGALTRYDKKGYVAIVQEIG